MKVENEVHPTPDHVREFVSGKDEPVVMVKLIKFKERAEYADGRPTELSGQEAYGLYATEMRKLVEAAGGRFIYSGEVESVLLGQIEEPWDVVGLVEYPSPRTLIEISSTPEFAEIEQHRAAGLDGQLNLAVRGRDL